LKYRVYETSVALVINASWFLLTLAHFFAIFIFFLIIFLRIEEGGDGDEAQGSDASEDDG
jgi:hypothetical protein